MANLSILLKLVDLDYPDFNKAKLNIEPLGGFFLFSVILLAEQDFFLNRLAIQLGIGLLKL